MRLPSILPGPALALALMLTPVLSAMAMPALAASDAATAAEALRPAEVAAFVRGLAAENARLESLTGEPAEAEADAEARAAEAALAMQEALLAGAEAAGMPLARYGEVKRRVYDVLQAIDTNLLVDETLMHVEVSSLDPATREQLRAEAEALRRSPDPYAGLAPAVAAALRAREAELMGLRASNIRALARAAARGT
ncbi:hypothetical protein [Arenimonas fontis]|uniref:Uncharacterized protein n=1 Tax=Arenimonas fontis TaxID=2608255 RepID=A0A5B2ZE18_9GAMM|nr:hypothetical protein [Arenimonas fontis]KAA2286287.1 hypothetical protein F0415_01965 [Arenimonas fontis]